jgi:uncharacterized protein YfaP (DUF2135 family)
MMIIKKVSIVIFISLFCCFIGCGEDSTFETEVISVSITSPEDGAIVNQRVIPITGTVNNPSLIRAVLTINGNEQVIPVVDGKFSQEAALMAGENQIEVSVIDGGTAKTNVTADIPPADLSVVLLWEGATTTAVNLYVVAPDDEEASLLYQDTLTTKIGGQMTAGEVNGRKYESFILSSGRAIKGDYLIKVNYYSDEKAIGQPINASVTVSINENTPQRMMKHFGLHTIKSHGLVDPEAWWVVTLVFLPDGLFSTDE